MSATAARILLIEDEAALRTTLGDRLRKDGYAIDSAADGVAGLEKASSLPFDLIVLDIMLPGLDGFTICRRLRASGVAVPVLMLTARTGTGDTVTGLEIGADDYVAKPFRMPELVARIGAILRRAPAQRVVQASAYQFGDLHIDVQAAEVSRAGVTVNLSMREFALLRFLVEHAGTAISRTQLLTEVWGYHEAMFTRTVDVHIASLRQKIEEDPRNPRFLITVQRLGYRFKP